VAGSPVGNSVAVVPPQFSGAGTVAIGGGVLDPPVGGKVVPDGGGGWSGLVAGCCPEVLLDGAVLELLGGGVLFVGDVPPPGPLPHAASVATASGSKTLISPDFFSTICSEKRTAVDLKYRNHVTLISKCMRR
jgi:hypothetical protein